MKLKNILQGLENLKLKGDLDLEIEGIESNSKNVKPGFLFIAIKGFSVDGHKYINNAIENGARCCNGKRYKRGFSSFICKLL